MRYQTGTAFRTALETRLAARARESGISIQRLRRTVAFERILARLLVVAPDRWLLKGGLALDFRLGSRARTTKDMDLTHLNDPASATADLVAAGACDLGDYFAFAITRADDLDDMQEATAVRYRVLAELGGRTFEDMIIDIGFVEGAGWATETLVLPDVLSFAEIAPITVPIIPLAKHVAEKLHAYTRAYGDGTRTSSREKDLVDLVVIAMLSPFSARKLSTALTDVFAARGRQTLPVRVPPPPASWGVIYGKLAGTVGISSDISAGHALVADFLDPLLSTDPPLTATWHPVQQRWLLPDEQEVPS